MRFLIGILLLTAGWLGDLLSGFLWLFLSGCLGVWGLTRALQRQQLHAQVSEALDDYFWEVGRRDTLLRFSRGEQGKWRSARLHHEGLVHLNPRTPAGLELLIRGTCEKGPQQLLRWELCLEVAGSSAQSIYQPDLHVDTQSLDLASSLFPLLLLSEESRSFAQETRIQAGRIQGSTAAGHKIFRFERDGVGSFVSSESHDAYRLWLHSCVRFLLDILSLQRSELFIRLLDVFASFDTSLVLHAAQRMAMSLLFEKPDAGLDPIALDSMEERLLAKLVASVKSDPTEDAAAAAVGPLLEDADITDLVLHFLFHSENHGLTRACILLWFRRRLVQFHSSPGLPRTLTRRVLEDLRASPDKRFWRLAELLRSRLLRGSPQEQVWEQMLCAFVNSASPEAIGKLAEIFAHIKEPNVAPVLLQWLDRPRESWIYADDELNAKKSIIRALARLGTADVVEVLLPYRDGLAPYLSLQPVAAAAIAQIQSKISEGELGALSVVEDPEAGQLSLTGEGRLSLDDGEESR